jgi:O-antigen/teichoic acid export membrane protein
MMGRVCRLIKHGGIYLIASALTKGITLLTIPIFTRYLTVEEYGIVSLLTVFQSILISVFSYGQIAVIKRSYFEYRKEKKDFKLFYSTVVFGTLFSNIVLSIIILTFGKSLFSYIFKGINFNRYALYVIGSAVLIVFYNLCLKLYETKDESIKYLLLEISNFILNIGLSLILILIFQRGSLGRIQAIFISSIIMFFVNMLLNSENLTLKWNKKIYIDTLKFGIPFIPHYIANFILNMSDRMFLNVVFSTEIVAIYTVGYQIGQIVDLVASSIVIAWSTIFMDMANSDHDNKKDIARLSFYFFAGIVVISYILSIFSREIVVIISNDKYLEAYKVIPIVALGYIFKTIYYITTQQLIHIGRIKSLPISTIVAAILNIILNYFFIDLLKLGMIGAAIATNISFLVMMTIIWKTSQKYYYIPHKTKQIVTILLISLAFYIPTIFVNINNIIINIIFKFVLLCIYLLVMIFTQFRNELYEVIKWFLPFKGERV